MALEPGREATVEEMVTEAMTASALGSGDVAVLGTPAVVALAERAAVHAIADALEPEETSVGSWIELSHLAPTPVGGTVSASARLTEVEGRTLTFAVSVRDAAGEVARGLHRRVMVDRARFLGDAKSRVASG